MAVSSASGAASQAQAERPRVKRWEAAAVLCLIALQISALIYLAWRTGVTVDEPAHLLSAHLFWQGRDNLKPRDMPPAIKIVGGWVPGFLGGLPIPYDLKPIMDQRHEWPISLAMIERLAGRTPSMFFASRLPLLIFPLLTLLLLWWWARQLLSPATAVVLALLFALEPTALGHGALFKNDLASTFGFLLFWYTAWRFWRFPGWKTASWVGVGMLVAILTKLSMMILLGIGPAVIVARYALLRPLKLRAAALSLLLVLLIPYLGSLAACQFDTRRLTSKNLADYAKDPNIPPAFLAAARIFRVLPYPELLFDGTISILRSNADGARIYVWGRTILNGTPLYFLLALAVKMPVALQVLLIAGAILEWLNFRSGRLRPERLFWVLPGLMYAGLASLSSLQLGVRLVLPAMPFGLLIAGNAVEWLRPGRRRAGLALAAGLLLFETARIYPHNISFFNLWVGGPEKGSWYLSDSNIDWGQNVGDLQPIIERLGIKKLKLSYFGSDDIWSKLSDQIVEPLAPPWSDDLAMGTVYQPKPGYYAISATLLPGHFFQPKYRDYYQAFRSRTPIARAAHSILVYKFD